MTTQYKEVKRKANVGERIKIVDAGYAGIPPVYANGDEVVVVGFECPMGVEINRKWSGGCNAWVAHDEYVVLEEIKPPAELAFPEAIALFMRENAAAVRKYLDEIAPATTINSSGGVVAPKPLTRADEKLDRGAIIEKAKADIAELTKKMSSFMRQHEGNRTFQQIATRPEFHVNRNKRAVMVLVRKQYDGLSYKDGEILERGIARCAPGDVFHAEIGKAIALRKALGLVVPDEYLNAPQPDKKHVGMYVKFGGYRVSIEPPNTVTGRCYNYAENGSCAIGSVVANEGEIIDDTDVDYCEGKK